MKDNYFDDKGINCPLCGDNSNIRIREYKTTDILSHLGIDRLSKKIIPLNTKVKELWGQEKAFFFKCNNCKLEFAYPFISGDSEFYSMIYDDDVQYPVWSWGFEISFNCISGIIKNNEKKEYSLLEIGAGSGKFVKRISKTLIKPTNIVTTEFSEYGKSQINDLGIICLSDSFTELINKGYENSFDFICMFQVLEHLDKIDDVFKSLFKLLKKNGHLLISVPNNIHRLKYEKIGIVEDVPPIHILRWSFDSFLHVEKLCELKMIEHKIQNGQFLNNFKKYIFLKYKNIFNSNSENRVRNYFQKFKKLMIFLLLSIWNIIPVFQLLSTKSMGISQWVHFKKE